MVKQTLEYRTFVRNWLTEIIREHRKTFDKAHLRDFVDLYIDMQTEPEKKKYTGKK